MRSAIISALAVAAAAVPVQRATAPTDVEILNYALTLEHLEATFYKEALAKFTPKDFADAGVGASFYNNLKEIASDEQNHVEFLTSAIEAAKGTPVKACTYDFNDPTVASFLATANILEGVGTSAYLGAAQYITNKAYLTAAGSILTIESRHSAYLRSSQLIAQSPFPDPFDIPLDFDEVYTLASAFITGCPSTNPPIPANKAFTSLTLVSSSPAKPIRVGYKLTVKAAKSVAAKGAYFITSTGPVSAKLSGSGTDYVVTVPTGVNAGQEYLVLTSSTATPSDSTIVAGPAIVPIQATYTETTPP